MSQTTICKPITIMGGQDPQSMSVSAMISSTWPNINTIDAYLTVNGGAAQQGQTFTSSIASYSGSVSGLVSGDVVRLCIDADFNAAVDDTGVFGLSGAFTQTDGSTPPCEKSYNFTEQCLQTAVGELGGGDKLDCSGLPSEIECNDLPFTVNVPNATAYTVSFSGSDYSFSTFTSEIFAVVAGVGGNETVTITATNGNPAEDCTATVNILECDPVAADVITANGLCATDGGPPFEPWVWCGFGDTPINNVDTGGSASGTTCGLTFLALNNTIDGIGQTHIVLTSPLPPTVTEFTVVGGGSTATINVAAFAGQTSFTITGQNPALHNAMSGTSFTIQGNC